VLCPGWGAWRPSLEIVGPLVQKSHLRPRVTYSVWQLCYIAVPLRVFLKLMPLAYCRVDLSKIARFKRLCPRPWCMNWLLL